jgi:putative phage-type endonuclease
MTVKEIRIALKEMGAKGFWKLKKSELEELYKELSTTPESEVVEKIKEEGVEVLEATSKEEWLEIRKQGIGGSEIGSILGINKYSSKIDVYVSKNPEGLPEYEKINSERSKKMEESEIVQMGHVLEPVIADLFRKKNPNIKVIETNKTFIRDGIGVCNPDGFVKEGEEYGILEIKTTSAFNKKEWEDGVIPNSYFAQVQWYLWVTGLKFAYIAVLIGGQEYMQYKIDRSEEDIKLLVSEANFFWQNNIIGKNIPEPDGSSAYSNFIEERAKKLSTKNEINVEGEGWERYIELSDEIKSLEKELKTLKQGFLKKAVEAGATNGKWGELTYKVSERVSRRVDTKSLKEAGLYEEFSKESTSRVLTIK